MREHRSPATGVGAGICICHSEKEACAMDVQGSDDASYKVVVNHEEQYSIWPADRENALGWKDAGKSGSKEQCLEFIEEVWTDMRPLSLRKRMEITESDRTDSD